jgi:two-component system, NarL family, sensor histidine kinase UhpB
MLEDNPLDAIIIQKMLSRASFSTEFTVTSSGEEYINRLNDHQFDLILCDYQLPGFDAIKALHARNQKNSSIPFILVSGAVSEEIAISIIKEGANDYILKDRLQRLPVAIEKAIRKQQLRFDKQSAEASLSQLTERFQLAAKTSFDIIWDYDLEKGLVYCSDAIEKIIGSTLADSISPHYLKKFIHPDDLTAIKRSFIQIIKSRDHRWRKLFRVIRVDGSIAWVNTNAMVLRNRHEKATRVVGVMHDITEVRRLQHELIEREMQNQKQIAQITLQAQEKERTAISRELHDNVNQLLATAKIMIDTATANPDMRDICLSKSKDSIMEAINELRNLAHDMMPPAFENNNFENILSDFAWKINLTGKIKLKFSLPPAEKLQLMDNNRKLAFYRIIQEQVSNILKHAKAKNISIIIDTDASGFTLAIEDDGIGFNAQKRARGIGLKNIENRCTLLGGTMNITTSPGEGCILMVKIPAKNQAVFNSFGSL